jgi:hypothetical protein
LEVEHMAEEEEQELDRLFGLPLDAFVGARDEAARALRRCGDTGAAERVGALRKPSVSAWAVNQLARRHPDRLGRLLESGERLRAAHRAALTGGGRTGLAEASRAERVAVAELVEAAAGALAAAGRPASEAVRDRIAGTLHAAAREGEAAELVRKGRLVRDLDPSGFGGLVAPAAPGDAPPAEPEAAGRSGREAPARERRRADRRAREEARRQASAAADAAILARRQAERLRHAADRAEEAAARARSAADAAAVQERASLERAARLAAALAEAEGRLAE